MDDDFYVIQNRADTKYELAFSCSCNVGKASLGTNDERKEVQPLKLLLLSFVYSAAICTLRITLQPEWGRPLF